MLIGTANMMQFFQIMHFHTIMQEYKQAGINGFGSTMQCMAVVFEGMCRNIHF